MAAFALRLFSSIFFCFSACRRLISSASMLGPNPPKFSILTFARRARRGREIGSVARGDVRDVAPAPLARARNVSIVVVVVVVVTIVVGSPTSPSVGTVTSRARVGGGVLSPDSRREFVVSPDSRRES